MARIGPSVALLIAFCIVGGSHSAQYFGKLIGKLSELHHGVSGEVYAVDGRTLYIKDFTYDGQGPGGYFYASGHKEADKSGFRLRDETGSGDVIRRYRKEGVTLTLPEGKTLNNIKIFYVWCEDFDVNFGDVKIPRNFDYPRPQKIAALKGVHSISSDNIVIVDAQTLLIPNLSYDGEAPDAKFWVGRGPKPSPQGVRVPDENGKETPLRRYDGKTVVLTLPGDLTVFDVGHFGVWCEQFTVDFGHVVIPQGLNAPPSLRMLGVSPQKVQQHRQDTIQNKVSRPLVGGHLQPTTFRPPSPFSSISRRNDYQPQQYITQQEVVLAQSQVDQAYRARTLALENIPEQQLTREVYHQQPPLNHIQPYIQQYQAHAQHRLDVRHQPQVELQPFNQQQTHSQSGNLVQLQHQPISQHRIHQLGNQIQSQYQLINQVQQPQINNLHAQSQLNVVSSQPSYIQQSRQAQNHPQINQPSNQILDSNTQTNRFFQQQIVNVSPQQQQQQPSNLASVNQRQYQEQLAYDQYLQARRHQEEDYLRNQLSRQHNRFDSPSHQNFNLYG